MISTSDKNLENYSKKSYNFQKTQRRILSTKSSILFSSTLAPETLLFNFLVEGESLYLEGSWSRRFTGEGKKLFAKIRDKRRDASTAPLRITFTQWEKFKSKDLNILLNFYI